MTERRPNTQRSRETRGKVLWSARQLFADKGYAAASTPAIVAGAQVTRGAMYHHFPDKAAVFAGVVNAELADVGQRMAKAAQANPDPVEQLILGGEAYVLAMAEPGRRRILLVEGAAVLGPEKIEALRAQHLKIRLEAGLRQIVEAGIMPDLPVAATADLLTALFDRVALTADRETFNSYRLALRALIGGLKVPPPASGDFVLG